jgi:hypothetical protein
MISLLKEWNIKRNDFENWLTSFDISLSFQNIRKKSLYEAVEIVISKFCRQSLPKAAERMCNIFLI